MRFCLSIPSLHPCKNSAVPQIPRAGILDLPTELLLQVFQDDQLNPIDLYSLGTLSKRLNSLAIPCFLASHFVNDPEAEVLTLIFNNANQPSPEHYGIFFENTEDPSEPKQHVLGPAAGIMIAFDLTSVRFLECTLPQSFADISVLLQHFSRVESLISRLDHVQSLTILFDGDNKRRSMNSNPHSAVSIEFAEIMARILEYLLNKGCDTLELLNKSSHIKNIHEIENDIPIEETDSLIRASSAQAVAMTSAAPEHAKVSSKKPRGMIKRAKAKLESLLDSSVLSHSSPPLPPKEMYRLFPKLTPPTNGTHSSLRSLHIQTPFSLLPRCLPAIRNLIHCSVQTLTTLKLSHLIFHEDLFDACLSALSLSPSNSITHLTIIHCHRISATAFMRFLSNFNEHLEYLEFDREISYAASTSDPRRIQFPDLVSLKAPLDWVDYLLGYITAPAEEVNPEYSLPLPNLMYLTIYCRSLDALYFSYKVFYPLLDPILIKLQSRSLTLSRYAVHSAKVAITLDIRLDKSASSQMDLDRIVFNFQMAAASKGSASRTRDHLTLSHGQIQVSEHWYLITALDISPLPPPLDLIDAKLIAKWVVTLFPGVERVKIPAPYIALLLSTHEYWRRQKAIASAAASLLTSALKQSGEDVDAQAQPFAWRRLVVGDWSFSLDE